MINDTHFTNFPKIESKRLIFRKFNLNDAKDIHEIRSHDKVMQFMDSDYHKSLEESQQFISDNIERFKNKKGIFWAIVNKETNECIGDFAFWNINFRHHRGEIGYSLKPKFWGKGLMSETLITLLQFGFGKLNLHSIEANINPNNNKSKKLLLNIGFRKEALFIENYFHNNKYMNSEVYSLLE